MDRQPLPLVPAVSCDDCGACCMGVSLPPGLFRLLALDLSREYVNSLPGAVHDRSLWESMPAPLREELTKAYEGEKMGFRIAPCLWLDTTTRRCRHYEHRPTVCREFVVGGEWCLLARSKRGVA